MKKELEKKLKNLPYRYYMEAVKSGKIGDYGLNRKNIGKFLCKLACDNGSFLLPTVDVCLKLTKDLEESGLIQATFDKFIVAKNWEIILNEKFPKALNKKEGQQPKEKELTEEVPAQQQQSQAPVSKMTQVTIGSLKNNFDFYKVLLERIGENFVSQTELKDSVLKLYKENFGCTPEGKQYFYNRVQFLRNSGILESIEDEGVVKYLRSSKWEEILGAKKHLLMKNPFEFKTPKPEPQELKETPKEEKPVVAKELICVCIDPEDLRKLYETEIVFNDGRKCIILIEPIPANLDVLKNIKVEVDPLGQQKLWEKFEAQRRYFADELRKIYRLCGKEA